MADNLRFSVQETESHIVSVPYLADSLHFFLIIWYARQISWFKQTTERVILFFYYTNTIQIIYFGIKHYRMFLAYISNKNNERMK